MEPVWTRLYGTKKFPAPVYDKSKIIITGSQKGAPKASLFLTHEDADRFGSRELARNGFDGSIWSTWYGGELHAKKAGNGSVWKSSRNSMDPSYLYDMDIRYGIRKEFEVFVENGFVFATRASAVITLEDIISPKPDMKDKSWALVKNMAQDGTKVYLYLTKELSSKVGGRNTKLKLSPTAATWFVRAAWNGVASHIGNAFGDMWELDHPYKCGNWPKCQIIRTFVPIDEFDYPYRLDNGAPNYCSRIYDVRYFYPTGNLRIDLGFGRD